MRHETEEKIKEKVVFFSAWGLKLSSLLKLVTIYALSCSSHGSGHNR